MHIRINGLKDRAEDIFETKQHTERIHEREIYHFKEKYII